MAGNHQNGGDLRFEPRDIRSRAIVRGGIWITLVIVAICLLLIPFVRFLASSEERGDPVPAALARADPDRLPPEPRLQTDPFSEYIHLKADQQAVLASAGWVDEKAGVARIPIDEAVRILLDKGLPSRGDSFAATQAGAAGSEGAAAQAGAAAPEATGTGTEAGR